MAHIVASDSEHQDVHERPILVPAPLLAEEPRLDATRELSAVPFKADAELRLTVDPGRLTELASAEPIVAHARNKGTVRVVKAIYYDTPAHALHRAGVTLQVCQIGKRFVQTVTLMAGSGAEPVRRGEWETPASTMMPDVQSLMPLLPVSLHDTLSHQPLQPAFTTELRRHVRELKLPAALIQVAVDRGVIRTGDKTVPISELTLTLKQGSPAALYELALPLVELGSATPATRSTAERGFALAFGIAPDAHPASRPLTGTGQSLDDAFAAILRSSHAHLLENRAAAEDGRDPEGIHQMRVALRRLRSALNMLRPLAPSMVIEAFRDDAKWLASRLGEARNWDVFLGEILGDVQQGCGSIVGFDLIRAAGEQSRARCYAAVRETLADRRTGRFMVALGAWIEQRGWRNDRSTDELAVLAAPASAFAGRALAKQHAKVLKRGRHFNRLPVEERHDLRLAVKRLRYAADFFLPLFGEQGSAKRYLRRLGRLQERLGRYNDATVTRHLMEKLPAETMQPDARQAMGTVLGWQACRLASVETEMRSAWRRFRDAARPWSGRQLGHTIG